jgi:hypothetical protein
VDNGLSIRQPASGHDLIKRHCFQNYPGWSGNIVAAIIFRRHGRSAMSWSAVAERSDDTAFGGRTAAKLAKSQVRESGVALRFPPQSTTRLL